MMGNACCVLVSKFCEKHVFLSLHHKAGLTVISASVWSAQHPNAGHNIQQLLLDSPD